ncbi:MAG TPA: PQQ-binding-like beta-propeller repeat protein [Candidatus Eisenbacteria bacterium]|nr:PQQ-binding-like beta-propeller repeat protein [Candidatus Eisenbacteria bacterium]
MNETADAELKPNSPPARRRPIRWWPAIGVLTLGLGAVIWMRRGREISFQEQNIQTTSVSLVTFLLLMLWCLFFSRLRWRLRLAICGGVVGLILLTAGLFEIKGVTGDLLPLLKWRWQKSKTATAAGKRSIPLSQVSGESKPIVPSASDFPQFLGPRRNATLAGPALARDWKAQSPEKLWRQPIGAAWSGFAVVANFAVTQEQRGEEELVVGYDLMTGKERWAHADAARYHTTIAGEGPRATPTIDGDRTYALGATGILNCLDLTTGKVIWSKDIVRDNHTKVNEWGMSGSPLVTENLVVVSPGGHDGRSLVAYQKGTGQFIWGGGSDGAGYSSPYLATIAGTAQVLIFNSGSLAAHDPQTGKVLWTFPWPGGHPHVAMSVMVPNDRVLVSSGYGTGSALVQIQRVGAGEWSASKLWKSIRLKAKFTNVIFLDGYVYGLDDGILVCLDASTGEQKWKEGRYGHGQEILVGKLLLLTAENGDVLLLEPVPQEPRVLSRFSALNGKTWNPPALAGPYLLVRNDLEAACYRLPVEK